jgi:cell division protein FtsW
VLVGLFALFGYAGFRTAQRARDRYGKLLAAGLTALVLVQAVVNLFAVMGLAPLTGVPLPFVSYGNSNLLVMLSAVGLMLNVAKGGRAPVRAAATGTRRRRRRSPRSVQRPRASSLANLPLDVGRLRVLDGGRSPATARERSDLRGGNGRHSRGRYRRARGSGARRRGRAAR